MKRIFLYALAVGLLALASCDTQPLDTPDAGSDAALSFTYRSYRSSTRAIAKDYEGVIHDMDVFAFAADGSYIGHMAEGVDYTQTDNGDNTTTLSATRPFLIAHAGQTVVFYFVGNNRASNDLSTYGAAKHIASFTGTENQFAELLTNPLGDTPWWPYEKAEIMQCDPAKGALLMTGRQEVALTGKQQIPVTLKRRVARFDLVNPAPENLIITGICISDAKTQGAMFGNATGPHTIASRSVELIDGPGRWDNAHVTYDSDNRAAGLFYLYPTRMGETTIVVQGYIVGRPQDVLNFAVKSDIEIIANRRYTLEFNEQSSDFILDPGDWIDSGSLH